MLSSNNSKAIKKDLNSGMICKSLFKSTDSKYNNNNDSNFDINKRIGSSLGSRINSGESLIYIYIYI